jgi:hypothetical protein
MTKNVEALVKYRIEQADESLEAATILFALSPRAQGLKKGFRQFTTRL